MTSRRSYFLSVFLLLGSAVFFHVIFYSKKFGSTSWTKHDALGLVSDEDLDTTLRFFGLENGSIARIRESHRDICSLSLHELNDLIPHMPIPSNRSIVHLRSALSCAFHLWCN